MKTYFPDYNKKINRKILALLVIILLSSTYLLACSKNVESDSILLNIDEESKYSKFIEEELSSIKVERTENKAYSALSAGGITEAFDAQAIGAIETKLAKFWYPHYLATVVIAIDRDQTDMLISDWKDLYESQEELGMSSGLGDLQMIIAAMSYGLEGKDYTINSSMDLLKTLNKKSLLKINSFESPIIICYDYQGADLIEKGRNIELIIPSGGSISYKKGLLSKKELKFDNSLDEFLIKNNYRSLDGRSNPLTYPEGSSYEKTLELEDYEHFAEATRKTEILFQRKVLGAKRIMSINYREHLYFALIYIIIVSIWTGTILRRSMQRGISYASLFTGIILIAWALVRLIKYQVFGNQLLSRYLWYSYYIFLLSLPLVILWMAWAIDKPMNKVYPPKWWWGMGLVSFGLIILVFTNDLHGLVFKLDLSRGDWDINYDYGLGYYIILLISTFNLVLAFLILIKKSMEGPRKKRIVFPLGVFFLFILYNYQYIRRYPLIYETDLTIVTGLFTLLMFEASIASGLIPVNSKYITIFTKSPLKMQIIDKNKELAISSSSSLTLEKSSVEKAINYSPFPYLQEDESLLFANPIAGGYALWSKDISSIQNLCREIEESTKKLLKANEILAEEEKIRALINEKNEKRELMEELESEIAGKIHILTKMIEDLEGSEDEEVELARLALLLSYIKRKSNLFFKEKKVEEIRVEELRIYLDELCEMAKYSKLRVLFRNELEGKLAIRYASLFYDFFYNVTEGALGKGASYIIANLEEDEKTFTMRMLGSEDLSPFFTDEKLINGISAARGKITIKQVEDTVGISISFPKGGE